MKVIEVLLTVLKIKFHFWHTLFLGTALEKMLISRRQRGILNLEQYSPMHLEMEGGY